MNADELRMEIRRVLGVSTRAEVPTDPNSGTRRFVVSLNRLSESQLVALLGIARKTVAIDIASGDERLKRWGPFAGEDSVYLVHRINDQNLGEVLLLGQEKVELPEGMRVKSALLVVGNVVGHLLATTPELLSAHLYVAHNLRQRYSERYTAPLMALTQKHPDKAVTIVGLAGKSFNVKESEVVRHHGVEPVLFDGVL